MASGRSLVLAAIRPHPGVYVAGPFTSNRALRRRVKAARALPKAVREGAYRAYWLRKAAQQEARRRQRDS